MTKILRQSAALSLLALLFAGCGGGGGGGTSTPSPFVGRFGGTWSVSNNGFSRADLEVVGNVSNSGRISGNYSEVGGANPGTVSGSITDGGTMTVKLTDSGGSFNGSGPVTYEGGVISGTLTGTGPDGGSFDVDVNWQLQ